MRKGEWAPGSLTHRFYIDILCEGGTLPVQVSLRAEARDHRHSTTSTPSFKLYLSGSYKKPEL